MRRARVLVACDRIGELDSAHAGAALARGFSAVAAVAAVAVVPLAEGGEELAAAFSALSSAELISDGAGWLAASDEVLVVGWTAEHSGWHPEESSAALGGWVAEAVARAPRPRVAIDLTAVASLDGGVGLLAAARLALDGRDVVGIVTGDELDLPATGLSGVAARRGYAAGRDVAEVLAADARLKAAADAVGDGLATRPGGGAGGGCALAVLGLGGRLLTGPQFCHWVARAERTLGEADLVVTGTSELTALDRGGVVLAVVAEWAAQAGKPCVAFAGGEELSRREVRTFGLEATYLLPAGVTEQGVTDLAERVAAGWFD